MKLHQAKNNNVSFLLIFCSVVFALLCGMQHTGSRRTRAEFLSTSWSYLIAHKVLVVNIRIAWYLFPYSNGPYVHVQSSFFFAKYQSTLIECSHSPHKVWPISSTIRAARSVCAARLGWHAACSRHRLPASLKQGAGTMRTQTLAATQRRRGAGEAAGSGGTTSPCGFSAGGAGGDTKLWCGGMKTYTRYSPGSASR